MAINVVHVKKANKIVSPFAMVAPARAHPSMTPQKALSCRFFNPARSAAQSVGNFGGNPHNQPFLAGHYDFRTPGTAVACHPTWRVAVLEKPLNMNLLLQAMTRALGKRRERVSIKLTVAQMIFLK